MRTVTVSKARLLETLQHNRDEHRALFLKAQERYREAAIEELDRMLAEARAGSKIRRAVSLPEPQDYTSSFDTAIQMVEWEEGDTVELDQHEFAQYVQNEWGWMGSFVGSTQAYIG
jgi:glyceraldehyde-3-phosphate dehydrogenase/erythrose-4-phosphate dehydrogenase